ncbi:MAG: hypothetical protein MUC83_19250 [Pirellula sp.]|nr:hypothetical protein [Pirellula sp.]
MRKRAIDKAKSLPEPKVKVLETNFADMKAGQTMVVPTPELIQSVVEATSKGKELSLSTLRQALAERTSAEVACPVTTSIFLRKLIVSEWAQHQTLSDEKEGSSPKVMFPFWRVVNPTMPLYKKLEPAIQAFIVSQRALEGIQDK